MKKIKKDLIQSFKKMEFYQGLKMSEKNLNFSPPATPPMDLSDTNSNNSNDFKVSENYSKIIIFLNHQIQISKLTSYKVL